MKHLLLTIIAAVLLVGCGESQQSAPAPEAKPVEPIAVAAKPTNPPKAVSAKKGSDPVRGIKPKLSSTKAPDISIDEAAAKGNIEAVKQHLDAGTDVNVKNFIEITALHRATTKEIALLLISKGADVNDKDYAEYTPLHYAALRGDKEIVELLITKVSDMNAKTRNDHTPLDLALNFEKQETADLLRKYGGKTSDELPTTTKAPDISIHDAAYDGNIEAVKKAIAAGANVNVKGDGGETPLHHATTKAVTELLIAEGADVNAKNAVGWTPLHDAALYGDTETSELLIAKSSNVNAKGDDGETPLHQAVYNGHKEVTELLISAGADVNAKDKKGKTPVSEAALWGHKEVTELLISAGADVNAKSDDGRTPLHYSARVGGFSTRHKEIVKLLIAKGADVNAMRDDGITPLDRAEKLEDYQKSPETKAAKKEIAALLRKHGGKTSEELKAEGK